MTDKQKKAVEVLNKALWDTALNREDYFLLLEFVVQPQPIIDYTPYYPRTKPTDILDPIYGDFGKVTATDTKEQEERQ